jgi:hypothetical protein
MVDRVVCFATSKPYPPMVVPTRTARLVERVARLTRLATRAGRSPWLTSGAALAEASRARRKARNSSSGVKGGGQVDNVVLSWLGVGVRVEALDVVMMQASRGVPGAGAAKMQVECPRPSAARSRGSSVTTEGRTGRLRHTAWPGCCGMD